MHLLYQFIRDTELLVSVCSHYRPCVVPGWTWTNSKTDSLKVDKMQIHGWANIH